MMRDKIRVLITSFETGAALVAETLWAHDARAVCDQSFSSVANSESDVFSVHSCSSFAKKFFDWEAQAYTVQAGDWVDRGFFDACNGTLEFPKHWNSAYVLVYGTSDVAPPGVDPGITFLRPFHGGAVPDLLTENKARSIGYDA